MNFSRRSSYLPVVLLVFLACLSLFVGVFWWSGQEHKTISLDEEYFLLVRDCEESTSAAIVGQVYASGGAGYLYGNSVVLACYFTERDAERVQGNLMEKGDVVQILALKPEEFVLRGDEVAASARISAGANTVDTCARILFDTANGLERTAISQDEARTAVRGVVKSLNGLVGGNSGGIFERWNAELTKAVRKGTEVASGILFAKDLRYLQIELCLAVAQIEYYFS